MIFGAFLGRFGVTREDSSVHNSALFGTRVATWADFLDFSIILERSKTLILNEITGADRWNDRCFYISMKM